MIKPFGIVTKIETKQSKDKKSAWGVLTILSDRRDKIYQVTDYDFKAKNDILEKKVAVEVEFSANDRGFLNCRLAGDIEERK